MRTLVFFLLLLTGCTITPPDQLSLKFKNDEPRRTIADLREEAYGSQARTIDAPNYAMNEFGQVYLLGGQPAPVVSNTRGINESTGQIGYVLMPNGATQQVILLPQSMQQQPTTRQIVYAPQPTPAPEIVYLPQPTPEVIYMQEPAPRSRSRAIIEPTEERAPTEISTNETVLCNGLICPVTTPARQPKSNGKPPAAVPQLALTDAEQCLQQPATARLRGYLQQFSDNPFTVCGIITSGETEVVVDAVWQEYRLALLITDKQTTKKTTILQRLGYYVVSFPTNLLESEISGKSNVLKGVIEERARCGVPTNP